MIKYFFVVFLLFPVVAFAQQAQRPPTAAEGAMVFAIRQVATAAQQLADEQRQRADLAEHHVKDLEAKIESLTGKCGDACEPTPKEKK